MANTIRNRIGGAALLVALAAGAFLAARYWTATQQGYQRVVESAACDLRSGPCTTALGEGRVSFAIEPADIPLMRTLTLRVETTGLAAESVTVEIRGLNMDMGLNRTSLQPDQSGSWIGETILPICSQRQMQWEAAVRLSGTKRIEVPFGFTTQRR